MSGMTSMAKDDATEAKTHGKTVVKDSVKVRLSLTKSAARKIGSVTRWEKDSERVSLELTGRG